MAEGRSPTTVWKLPRTLSGTPNMLSSTMLSECRARSGRNAAAASAPSDAASAGSAP